MSNSSIISFEKLKQAIALTKVNIKSFPNRFVASSVSMLSIACVSAVILSVLAMTQGMIKTLERTGLDNTLIIMRAGAVSELQSVMFPMEVNILANHQQVLKDKNSRAIYSAEMFVSAEVTIAADDSLAKADVQTDSKLEKLALRGISQNTYAFRPNFKILTGEKFKTGLRQVIIGQAIARKMPQLQVGTSISLGGTDWLISGVFTDNNSVFESELWADIGMVQSDYQRGNTIQSIRLAVKDNTDLVALNKEWQDDPRLNVRIMAEKEFFASQAKNLTRLIRWIGFPVAFVMALGAMIAALNTMYSTIASRSKEIATHKAIGFSPFAISFSILTEALLIALVGGLIGILPLYFAFDGLTASSQNANNLSQMMFNFDISMLLIGQALLVSIVIGLLGGLLPALKAMRLPVTTALRDN
jgi:putative ABC transport system permease protein